MILTNELIVRGEPSAIAEMIEFIWAKPPEGWGYEPEVGWKPPRRPWDFAETIASTKVFRFAWRGNERRPPAILSLRETRSTCLVLGELRGTGPVPLSVAEFNGILHHFYRNVLRDRGSGLGVGSSLLPPTAQWEQDLPYETGKRLRDFDDAANRVVLYPADWRRWDAFVIQSHRDEAAVRDNLEVWLIHRGWAEGRCAELMVRYEIAAQLLHEYDEVRAGA